ncbi:zinc-dependent alcohol dehydrogenase [Mycolicibacterium sp. 120320]|uniref:zinc-dependent alcohol dehydrogenase n=2 Tax=unclassified Mycolicibacterium TaxID=2636767 RepID=UPI002ED7EC2C
MTSMLAARAHRGSDSIVLEQIPIPQPGPRDVVVRVVAAGITPGTMRLLRDGMFKHFPTTLGHEAAGTVAAVGTEVDHVSVGDRVRVHPNLNCGICDYCCSDRDMMCAQQAMIGYAVFGRVPTPIYDAYHDGGLAEYIRVPHSIIDGLPDNVSFDVGAKVHDLANAVRALKCAELPVGSTIVVTAATGTMGTATIKLAEHFGVSRLILCGRSTERLRAVEKLAGNVATDIVALDDIAGDWTVNDGLTRRIRELVPGGVHGVIDFIADGPATGQVMAAMANGGTLVHMGANPTPLPFPPAAMMVSCWRYVGTRSCTRSDARQVLQLLADGALNADELITHRYPLSEVVTAVSAMQSRVDPSWMTVINP